MLPEPFLYLNRNKIRKTNVYERPVVTWKKYHNKQDHLILRALRVEVVLCDPSRDSPLYLGEWHLFLPSDVFLGKYVNVSDSRCSLFFFLLSFVYCCVM